MTESAPAQIGNLSNKELLAIFKHLPPTDRLLASEVCVRWHDLVSEPWSDMLHLDVSMIPATRVGAVIRHCPNLLSITASGGKTLYLADIRASLPVAADLTTMSLYNCLLDFNDKKSEKSDEGLESRPIFPSTITELVFHKVDFQRDYYSTERFSWPEKFLPPSLRRLQFSGLEYSSLFYGIRSLAELDQKLECLILNGITHYVFFTEKWLRRDLHLVFPDHFQFLRELQIGVIVEEAALPGNYYDESCWYTFELPDTLEILFLNDCYVFNPVGLAKLITEHPKLRILVVTEASPPPMRTDDEMCNELGEAEEVDEANDNDDADEEDVEPDVRVPRRPLDIKGTDPPAARPFLNVFLGNAAASSLSFSDSPKNAMSVEPIDRPLSEFLECDDIRTVFEGVWIAKMILNAAQHGAVLGGRETDITETIHYYADPNDAGE